VGRRAVQRSPEGNFPSRWRVPGSCATRRPSKRGYGVFGVRGGRGIRLCRTRYRLNRGVRIPGNHPRLERGRTRVVSSTVLRRRRRSATANGACFGMLSPPRVRGRCRPSPVTGRGTVRTANESEPRIPHRVCRWWAWNRPYQREATPCLPIESLRDWLTARYDAGLLDNVGCGGCVGFILALKHGAFSSILRNFGRGGRSGDARGRRSSPEPSPCGDSRN
jgi:hypothetical protein